MTEQELRSLHPNLIPRYQRICHSLIRTPFIGALWLVLGFLVCTSDSSYFVKYAIASVFFFSSMYTALPSVFLTPVSLIASLFFLGGLNEIGCTMYIIVWAVGVFVYLVFATVQVRIMTGKYEVSVLTRAVCYNMTDYISGRT